MMFSLCPLSTPIIKKMVSSLNIFSYILYLFFASTVRVTCIAFHRNYKGRVIVLFDLLIVDRACETPACLTYAMQYG
jgi:hypothetical protein